MPNYSCASADFVRKFANRRLVSSELPGEIQNLSLNPRGSSFAKIHILPQRILQEARELRRNQEKERFHHRGTGRAKK
jgi:hypothetical protein